MRSRYAAFALRLEQYLLATWHPSTRPANVGLLPQQKWLGLRIIACRTITENSAEVEFIARYRIGGGSAARLHERSRFLREDGRWLYIDGDIRA